MHLTNAIRNAQFSVAKFTVADFTDPTKKWLPNFPLPTLPFTRSTPLPWLPVLSSIELPALRRKAATDKLVE